MAPATALLGDSVAMTSLRTRIALVAASSAPTLLHGATGTGKELVARALHDASPRAAHPYVVVDCGALAPTVLESELFGHQRGAFTGADTTRPGAFEAAHRGTVFLDEIGELPLALQPKLLRALESHQIRPVGANAHREVDVRFVSATWRDLRAMVREGTFREDLYFRLSPLTLEIPPLDAHRDDIPALAEHFFGAPLRARDRESLQLRAWPGNVRELRNAIEHLKVFGTLPDEGDRAHNPLPVPVTGLSFDAVLDAPLSRARDTVLHAFERAYLTALVVRHGRDPTALARHAGVDKSMIYRLLRRHADVLPLGPRERR